MDSGSEPSVRASGSGFGAIAFAGLVGATLLGAMLAGDGSDVGGILLVGGAAVVALVAALVVVALGRAPVPAWAARGSC